MRYPAVTTNVGYLYIFRIKSKEMVRKYKLGKKSHRWCNRQTGNFANIYLKMDKLFKRVYQFIIVLNFVRNMNILRDAQKRNSRKEPSGYLFVQALLKRFFSTNCFSAYLYVNCSSTTFLL